MKEIKILIADPEDGDIFNGARGIIKYGNVAEELTEFSVANSINGAITIKIESCGRPLYCGLDNVRYTDQYYRKTEDSVLEQPKLEEEERIKQPEISFYNPELRSNNDIDPYLALQIF